MLGANATTSGLTEAEKLLVLLKATPEVSMYVLYSEMDSALMTSNHRDWKAAKKLRLVTRLAGEEKDTEGEQFDFSQLDDTDG